MKVLSYVLIAAGILVLGGYALYAAWLFFSFTEIPVLIRVGLGVLGIGFLVLLIAMWIEKKKEGDEG
ncbi:MAG: hypothetical protein C4575_13835 [Desulforudis sp.]|nr:hypothetical protein [Clostridia bacterium]MDQ7792573.1 hypothetical protein [Clostridia bacterium]RJX17157.1 MAG: hypothetical protein C4575_13835 [Desulforudis sp.]